MATGDEILAKAKAHWDQIRGEVESVAVPEWDTTIYYRPANLKEMADIQKKLNVSLIDGAVEMLIVRARNETGERLFKPVHRTELMNFVHADVALRIVNAMHTDPPEVGEAEKN